MKWSVSCACKPLLTSQFLHWLGNSTVRSVVSERRASERWILGQCRLPWDKEPARMHVDALLPPHPQGLPTRMWAEPNTVLPRVADPLRVNSRLTANWEPTGWPLAGSHRPLYCQPVNSEDRHFLSSAWKHSLNAWSTKIRNQSECKEMRYIHNGEFQIQCIKKQREAIFEVLSSLWCRR